ncbi:S8 family peptidase [Amycolatopsis minnesotensis]|uniref:S8 family peptidase n=1 Tax=Amycolatopsis minnesotensis TaxID=337894 RepID=A0ABN2SBD7_9PSEU
MKIRWSGPILAAALVMLPTPAYADGGEQPNPPNAGLDRIDQRTGTDHAYHYETTADQVTAYVIDTGVDGKNPDFEGRVEKGKDFVDGDDDGADGNGHGTHLAGIIGGKDFGVAKKVKIVPVRVLDNSGSGATNNILAGIKWVTENARQPAVAVLGIGGAPNPQLDEAVRALAAVVPVTVPAGGEGTDAGGFSPAREPSALTVGASDNTDRVPPNSNTGAVVDLFAPGVEIPGPAATGIGSGPMSGTSMSAAFVAGAAALYRGLHPEASAPGTAAALVANATKDVLNPLPQGTGNRLLYTLTPQPAAPTPVTGNPGVE